MALRTDDRCSLRWGSWEAQGSARQLARTLDQVELGREKLRGAPVTAAEEEFGETGGAPETPAAEVELHDQEIDEP